MGFRLRVRTDYNDIGKLQYLVRSLELPELDTVYADQVEMFLLVPSGQINKVEKEITEKTAGKALIERQEELRYGAADGEVILL